MHIDNQLANELLCAFRRNERMNEFMDAVSGVKNYKLSNIYKQGIIRSAFAKELISDQFLLELEDIISIFWQGVFTKVDEAKLWGTKDDNGQPIVNNPINYLRYHGKMSVRNYITSLYRQNLRNHCANCGHAASVSSDRACKKCGHDMQIVYKFSENTDNIEASHKQQLVIEHAQSSSYLNKVLDMFAREVLGENTRAYQVLRILTDPDSSRDMCKACGLCPADNFNMDMCTNYSANIGRYLGVNKTMIANKVRSIRKRLPEHLVEKNDGDAQYLLDLIPSKYKNLLPIID